MSKNEKVLKQWFQVGQEIMSGTADISAEDIDRFRRRASGPEGHPLLVRSERLRSRNETGHLEDMRALPDGRLCTLWGITDPLYGLRVQIGERGWLLKFAEPAVCGTCRIIGINAEDIPIVEMKWTPAHEAGAECSMIYLGEKPLEHTHSQVTTREHQAWTIGDDGRLYSMKRGLSGPADNYFLVGHDAVTGQQDVVCAPLYCDNIITSLAVRTYDEYALVSCEFDRMKDPAPMIVTGGKQRQGGRVLDAEVALSGGEIYLLNSCNSGDWASYWVRLFHEPYPGIRSKGRLPYHGGLTMLGKRFAYVGKMPHKQVGWIIGIEEQPSFARVTELFRHGDGWRYWALGNGQLFLMDLPLREEQLM